MYLADMYVRRSRSEWGDHWAQLLRELSPEAWGAYHYWVNRSGVYYSLEAREKDTDDWVPDYLGSADSEPSSKTPLRTGTLTTNGASGRPPKAHYLFGKGWIPQSQPAHPAYRPANFAGEGSKGNFAGEASPAANP